jgi:hypothetical protein
VLKDEGPARGSPTGSAAPQPNPVGQCSCTREALAVPGQSVDGVTLN